MLLTGIFVAAIVLPALLMMWLRTNAAVVFLALCAGNVLVTLSGEDARLVTSSLTAGNPVALRAVQVVLLTLPAVLIMFILRKTVAASKMPFQLLPAIATGVVGILLVVPLLTPLAQATAADNRVWQALMQYEEFILLVGVFGSLLVAGISARSKHDDKKKHHHK